MEWQWLLAFSNDPRLEIYDSRVQEEARLLAASSDTTTQSFKLVVITSQLQRKDEVLRIIDISRHIFEFKLKRTNSRTNA